MSKNITIPIESGFAVPVQTETVDPVCGMTVDISNSLIRANHNGEALFFCSETCKQKFVSDPWFYATGRRTETDSMSTGKALYICPMDPEVEQQGPGTCPKCGMALEPLTPASHEETNPELVDFTRRFKVGLLFTIPLFIISMGPMMGLPVSRFIPGHWRVWIEMVLATPVIFWVALPFFSRGIDSVRSMNFNMWTLIALGVSAAYVYSVVATLMPEVFPSVFKHNGHVPVYFESAAVVVILVLFGQILELNARAKTGNAIRSLLNLAPKTARRVNPDDSEYEVPLSHILVDDIVRLRPGESVPVDGTVLSGSTAIDESMITGEPMPVEKQTGASVTAGTVNLNGSLLLQATEVAEHTVLAKIIKLVSSAQRSRPPIQNLADQVARWFVPLVVIIALLAFVSWTIFGPSLAFAVVSAVSVLVIACPCALGLATPVSITTAMGRGAQSGVLIRDAASLEQMAKVDVVIVDKTGTLTEGKPYLTDCLPVKGADESELLSVAAALEQKSQHPLALAIEQAAQQRELTLPSVEKFSSITGKGVTATIDAKRVMLGNAALMQQQQIELAELRKRATDLQAQHKTVMYLARDGELLGVIAVADKLKPDTAVAVSRLKERNLEIILATGDNEGTARHIATQLGIDRCYANLLPEDKKQLIDTLHAKGKQVAMVGDGVNDAPALATADVGIAMGEGADVAVESAGITLLGGDLNGVVKARTLAQATIRNIKQNLFYAFFYNAVGVPVAAGILYPLTGTLLSPMFAAAAMSLSSVSVIGNALRLRRVDLQS